MLTTDSPNGTSTELLNKSASAVADERRASSRSGRKINLTLTGLGTTQGLGCISEDVSESGLYVRVPTGAGLMVGSRVEVQFGDEVESPSPSRFRGETCFATVVRTKAQAHESVPTLGAGLRFDQPFYL